MVSINVKALTFKLDNPQPHKAGQHYSVKLTAEDGYVAERDYSLANPPEQNETLEFGIELLREGEVSPYLFDMKEGEQIEVKGPIGHHFIWEADQDKKPLILIAGGSGMVPLRAMLLHHFNNYKKRDVVFFSSCRTIEHVLYQFELEKLAEKYSDFKLLYTLTEKAPENYKGYTRRIDTKMIEEIFGEYKDKDPNIFVCGPTPFVEKAGLILVEIGFDPQHIKTERFGGDNANLGH